MNHARAAALVAWIAFVGMGAPAVLATVPLEEFAAVDTAAAMEQPALSPDGRNVVYITHTAGKPIVAVYSLVTFQPKAIVRGEEKNFVVQWCRFKSNERILCSYRGVQFNSGRPYWSSRLVAINADGTDMKVLVQNSRAAVSQFQDQILHWLPDNPREVLIELDDDGNIFPSVFRLDVYSGSLRVRQKERPPVLSWLADRAGVVRFGYGFTDRLGKDAVYLARRAADGPDADWFALARFSRFEGAGFVPLGFGAGTDSLLVLADRDGRDAVWDLDLADARERQLVFAHPRVDVISAFSWHGDGRIAGFEFEEDKPAVTFVDPKAEVIQSALDKALPNAINRVIAAAADSSRYLFVSYSDVQPGFYAVLTLAPKVEVKILAQRHPSLAQAPMAAQKPVRVEGPDGLQLPGYLTLPPVADGRNLPAVIYPHGGPYARDSWGFDSVVQMLANRGYAVLQVNFRGSTGFGAAWRNAGFQGWGSVMHADITAGAHWLIKQGIADPARLCIVGWSYGGYAALIGVAREPGLYRCAASIAGVSDLVDLEWDSKRFVGGRDAARHAIGDVDMKQNSPRFLADRIKVPVLLVHGTYDSQVAVDQSRAMAKALDRADTPHHIVLIEGGDHSLLRAEWRLTLFRELEAFLAANLGSTERPAVPPP